MRSPRRTRATVTCGRNPRASGSCHGYRAVPGAPERRPAWCRRRSRRGRPPGRRAGGAAARPRGRPRLAERGAAAVTRPAIAPSSAAGCAPRNTRVTCSDATGHGAHRRVRPADRAAQAASAARAAPGSRAPRTGARYEPPLTCPGAFGLAAQQPADHVHRHGRRAVAHVDARARQRRRRVSRAPSGQATEKHTSPTGLSSVPPPGPAIAGHPDAHVGPERARARRRPAPRPPPPTPRRAPRSAPGRRRPARSWPRSSRRPRRRARTPTSPPARSAAPASSPPVHDSATRDRQAAPRSSRATCSSTVEPSSENSVSAWRSRTTSREAPS